MDIRELFTSEEWMLICAHAVHFDRSASQFIRDAVLNAVRTDGYEPGEGEFPGWAPVEKGVDQKRITDLGETGPDET